MTFDRKRLIDNIYRFAKEKDIKIGSLEQTAGVSVGYLSRLMKDDTKGSFAVDLLCSAAEQLGKTLDALVFSTEEVITDNERKMLNFLDKLTLETENHSFEWTMMPPMIMDSSYLFEHPLFRVGDKTAEDPDGNFHYYQETSYDSRFFDPGEVKIKGNCFHAIIDSFSGREIYIMSVSRYNNKTCQHDDLLEIYFLKLEKDVEPIICSHFACSVLKEAMFRLYETINDARSHLALGHYVMDAIDRFLNT